MTLAPIALFVYNRPEHTKKTLLSLSKNKLASESILYIYCDGVSENVTRELKEKNNLVKEVIREHQWCKEVIIVESKNNKGLAHSIITGVTEVVNQYGKIIVLEDDLITSRYFLEYMNSALDRYATSPEVLQISGFSFSSPKIEANNNSYFLSLSTTWGWATWKRAWNSINFKCSDYLSLINDKELTYRFNYNGSYNYKKMLLQQMESNKISSWGIRFYWNVFKQNAVVLYPDRSLVLNKGWDNTGKHKDNYDIFPMPDWNSNYKINKYPASTTPSRQTEKIIAQYLRKRTCILRKVFYKISAILYKNVVLK